MMKRNRVLDPAEISGHAGHAGHAILKPPPRNDFFRQTLKNSVSSVSSVSEDSDDHIY